jgi:hypothetical protein
MIDYLLKSTGVLCHTGIALVHVLFIHNDKPEIGVCAENIQI